MKGKYIKILLTIFAVSLTACSEDDKINDLKKISVSRPSVPINASEIQIGNQIWVAKNLNVSKYRNGDIIPQVQDANEWANLTTGAWCYYENNRANGITYGKLYNWYAVNDERGIAPIGFHVASYLEYMTLFDFLGGINVAGGKMKSTNLWEFPNTEATNSSHFSALPSGYRYHDGTFTNIRYFTNYWTSSATIPNSAWGFFISFNSADIAMNNYSYLNFGFAVRCIKN